MICHNSYKKKSLSRVLKTFSHYQQVSFAFYCAKDVETLANDPRIIDCNLIVERWLKGDKTVDLITAENNAWNVWHDVAAVYSVYSATAYSAASCIACIVSAASTTTTNAATAYYAAANAKSYNLYHNDAKQREIAYNQFLNEYNQIAKNWLSNWEIPNFPKESDFPIFDFLQDYNLISYLLPKKEDYYYLNLNGFDIKHVNETDLLKEINTIHIKNIIRRIINNDSAQQL